MVERDEVVARSCAMAKCAQRDELDEHEDGVRGSRPWTGERLPNWIAVVSRWRPRPFFRNFGIQAEAAARQRRDSQVCAADQGSNCPTASCLALFSISSNNMLR
jgi:hypothetical protein